MGCTCIAEQRSRTHVDSRLHTNEPAKGPLVLCIDDSPVILEMLEEVLKSYGLRTICTNNCMTGILLALSEPVDLIVLDYEMPEVNGLFLARELHACRPEVPLIMFSGVMIPQEASDVVSRIVPKGEGAYILASAINEALGFIDQRKRN